MTRTTMVTVLLSLAAVACDAGSEQGAAEVAPAGTLPPLTGKVLGPQPGPNRPMPEVQNPFEMESNVLAEGRRLFVWFNCSGCHGGHGGGGMGPSLRDVEWLYGYKDQDIFNSIAEGRPHGMPAWGTKLPSEQIWKLTAYIKSMGTKAEPQKPPQNPVFPNPPPRRDIPGRHAGGDG